MGIIPYLRALKLYQKPPNSSTPGPSQCMQLPEILDVIFKHLSHYTITTSASLVCKQWHHASQRHLQISVRWFLTIPETEQRASLIQLGNADTLYIQFQDERALKSFMAIDQNIIDNGVYLESWKAITNALCSAKKTGNIKRLRKLILCGDIQYEDRFYPLLPYLSGLTTLHLEKIQDSYVNLSFICSHCPNLQHLHLAAKGNDITGARDHVYLLWQPLQSQADTMMASATSTLGLKNLKTLALHGLSYGINTIKPLLQSCKEVTRVEIVQWNNWLGDQDDALTRSELYTILKGSCPNLQHLHIYLVQDEMTEQHAQNLITDFPKVQSMAFTTLDLLKSRSYEIIFPSDLSTHLTTLEITQSFETEPLAHILHRILCSSPTLLHLKAPKVRYWAEYLDLDGFINDNGLYSPEYCIQRRSRDLRITPTKLFHPWISREIWACRGLKTLKMWIEGEKGDARDTESSRIMFGYLSTVCPDLREIHIIRPSVNLTLEGGLCLMTKLKQLRKLEIETDAIPQLKRKDLFWLALSSRRRGGNGKKESIIQEVGRRKLANELRAASEKLERERESQFRYLSNIKPSAELRPEVDTTMGGKFKGITFRDIIESTKLTSILSVLETLEMEESLCWPELELFALAVARTGSMFLTRQEIEEVVRKTRGNMEIRTIIRHLR